LVTYKELLVKVAQKLDENKIDYYVTGSMAVELYAGRHIVSDIDIVVKREDLAKLRKVFFLKEVKRKNKYGAFRSLKYNRNRIEFSHFDDINKNGHTYSFGITNKRLLIILKLLLDRNTKGKRDRKDALSIYQKMKINNLVLLKLAFEYGVFFKTIDFLC
jgi:hypothetical protein